MPLRLIKIKQYIFHYPSYGFFTHFYVVINFQLVSFLFDIFHFMFFICDSFVFEP